MRFFRSPASLRTLVVLLAIFAGTELESAAQERREPALEYRTWTSRDGRQIEAAFLAVKDGMVAIQRKSDGETFQLPLDRLSEADQRWVAGALGSGAPSTSPATSPDANANAATIASWEKAGAEFGWIYINRDGVLQWRAKNNRLPGAIPSFQIRRFPANAKALPPPPFSFGLMLKGQEVTDAGLKQLASMSNLQTLTLSDTAVTDAGMKDIAAIPHLEMLNLPSSRVTDAGLQHLVTLKELQRLGLSRTKVTDAGMRHVAALPKLQLLNLADTKISDAGLKELASLTKLKSLHVNETKVTDAGLKYLAGMQQLETLNLAQTQLTDAGMKEIARLPKLQTLSLLAVQITDAGLRELTLLDWLEWLDIRGTKVVEPWPELNRMRNLRIVEVHNRRFTLRGPDRET